MITFAIVRYALACRDFRKRVHPPVDDKLKHIGQPAIGN